MPLHYLIEYGLVNRFLRCIDWKYNIPWPENCLFYSLQDAVLCTGAQLRIPIYG